MKSKTKLSKDQWFKQNKKTLLTLYNDYQKETGDNKLDFKKFITYMFEQTYHTTNKTKE